MSERDFKLLVREVFALQKRKSLTKKEEENLKKSMSLLEKELNDFTAKELSQLPFK